MLGERARHLLVRPVADRVREVLVEIPAERDVQHLRAPADREHRQVLGERGLQERQLGAVSLGDDAVRLRMRLLAVELRVEIRAAREDQPVERGERLLDPARCAGGTSSARPPARSTAAT